MNLAEDPLEKELNEAKLSVVKKKLTDLVHDYVANEKKGFFTTEMICQNFREMKRLAGREYTERFPLILEKAGWTHRLHDQGSSVSVQSTRPRPVVLAHYDTANTNYYNNHDNSHCNYYNSSYP